MRDLAHDVRNEGHKGVGVSAGHGEMRELSKLFVGIDGWCHGTGPAVMP